MKYKRLTHPDNSELFQRAITMQLIDMLLSIVDMIDGYA